MSDDITFEGRKRAFVFGSKEVFHGYLHQGKRGRWRWSVLDIDTGKTRCLPPVRGWETPGEAFEDAINFFGALGVEITDVR